MLGLYASLRVYHDIEVAALVSSFWREDAGGIQQLLQQLCRFVKMLLLATELALSVHVQQGVHLALITCQKMLMDHTQAAGGYSSGLHGGKCKMNRISSMCLTQLQQDFLPSRSHFSPGVA